MNRRWLILIVGLFAMIAGCAYQYGLPYLIPTLRADNGLSLREAAIVISCPVAGLLVALTLWGIAADRWGERIILTTGLSIAGLALLAAAWAAGTVPLGVCFFVAGAGGASIHAASGRLILGWFAAHERGLAMGVRQTGQPLGVGLSQVVQVPRLPIRHSVILSGAMGSRRHTGLLLVDLGVRRPIDVLPDNESATLATWLSRTSRCQGRRA